MARICLRRFASMSENHFTIAFKCSVETMVPIGRACIQQVHDGAKIARCLDDEGSNRNFRLVVVRNRPHYEQRETVGLSIGHSHEHVSAILGDLTTAKIR